MLKRVAFGLLFAVIGYCLGTFGGLILIEAASSNQHDRSVEAAMTGAFVIGPLVAIAGFIGGAAWAKPKRP
jgi:uncharacterized membrane protein